MIVIKLEINRFSMCGCGLVAQMVKKLPAVHETHVWSLTQEDPPEKETAAHSSMPGEFHGQRSLAGYSPWDGKESDMTEVT